MLLEIVLFGFFILFFNLLLLVYINWNKQWQPTPVILPGESHGQRGLVSLVHGVAESQTRLNDLTFTFHFHSLEKEMATHSSILAWRIPGTEEPGGLRSLGSQTVGHNRVTNTTATTKIIGNHTPCYRKGCASRKRGRMEGGEKANSDKVFVCY